MIELKPETLYRKVGKRYKPVKVNFQYDDGLGITVPVGGFVLVHAYTEGGRSYQYDVTPDTAAWAAAAKLSKEKMANAMRKRAPATAHISKYGKPYTEEQQALIAAFRKQMAKAGGLLPEFWDMTTVDDLAQAAIDEVTK